MSSWTLDLPAFKNSINYTKPGTADDADLTLACALGTGKVEELCGHVLTTTVTAELIRGSGDKLALKYRAASLTSLASYPSGTALTLADYRVDGQLLTRKDGGWISGPLTVTYTAGEATAPAWATMAARMIAAQVWRTQLRPTPGNPPQPVGFLIPNQAAELMADHLLAPAGFA